MSFHVLGPLEVRVGDERLVMGGAKQRAVLAVLLLRAGEVVPVERLVDEVWGTDPPPSAAHTLESYISRLRQLFNGHGPLLVRRGAGYAIELGDAALDSRGFCELQERASLAAAMDQHADVVVLTAQALAMWRGPALADVALASAGRAEADRLEELRLRTYELRFDAELALGLHERAIGELQALVAQNPYRERFVAQLMLALYRCGRHAEALEVYEQTRRRLDDDLGLQPSADLQQLSGQIVRQDARLQSPALVKPTPPNHRAPRSRRVATLVAGGMAAAAVMTLTASGSTPAPAAVTADAPLSASRVALVLSGTGTASVDDVRALESSIHFRALTGAWGHEAETVNIHGVEPAPATVERAIERVERGGFDLVVVVGEHGMMSAFAELARQLDETRFVFVDESLESLSLKGVPNATGIRFAVEESSFIVGYLSGLVSPRGAPLTSRVDAVSVVAAKPTPQTLRAIAGYRLGVRRANTAARVRVAYSGAVLDKTACERIANAQIDAGSDVVYALAGHPCSGAVVAVARIRGVWAIVAETDGGIPPSRHLLLATHKWWERAIGDAVNGFEMESLPAGGDIVLGIADDYSVGFDRISAEIPERRWSKVVTLCSKVRQHKLDVP
jgi:DNA-binding SARP family transcriptional activator/basic membrane lipoprotein Med (substrate-binding protein (PBP1-ABC) superfamily)